MHLKTILREEVHGFTNMPKGSKAQELGNAVQCRVKCSCVSKISLVQNLDKAKKYYFWRAKGIEAIQTFWFAIVPYILKLACLWGLIPVFTKLW